jgi:hypothetical protein
VVGLRRVSRFGEVSPRRDAAVPPPRCRCSWACGL